MSRTVSAPDVTAVRRAVEDVADPELPPVTVGMLGMIHDVTVDDDCAVRVELLPTVVGCPATEMIAADVRSAVAGVAGVGRVEVRFRFDPPWSSARISEEGHRALASFGIAPPVTVDDPTTDLSRQRPRLPLTGAGAAVACPYCGSADTVRESPFGPTPCRAIHYCNGCRQPFEAFKDL